MSLALAVSGNFNTSNALALCASLLINPLSSKADISLWIPDFDFKNAMIGINNRNLKTLKTDIKTTYDLHKILIKHSGPLVCESGIKSEKEVEEIVKKTKINNFLIGESLLNDIDKKSSLLKKITQIRP